MPWFIAMAAVAAVSAVASSKSAAAQNKNQQAWSEYNAQVQHNTDMNNIAAQTSISELNASMILSANEINVSTSETLMAYNTMAIESTQAYNDLLYEEELANMWEQNGLDMSLIGRQRARELGMMEANMAASGTVLGTGSNAEAVIDQKTQEALDLFVTKTGADIKAAGIINAKNRSSWEAEQEIKRLTFEGRVKNQSSTLNASLQSSALMAEAFIKKDAGTVSADTALDSGIKNAAAVKGQNDIIINNNLTTGLLGAASTAIQGASSMGGGGGTTA